MRSGDVMQAMFDDCIERMAQGDSLESCLQRYHAHADELRDLLTTVQAITALAVPPPPPPTLMTLGKQQFMRAVMQTNPVTAAAPTPARPQTRFFVWDWLRSPRPIGRPALVGLALFAVLALFTAFTALSISALPGDLFYPPKVAAETIERDVKTFFNREQASQIRYEFDLKRAEDAQKAIDLGRTALVTLHGIIEYVDSQTMSLDTRVRIALTPDLLAAYNPNLRQGTRVTVVGHTDPTSGMVQADKITFFVPRRGANVEAPLRPTPSATATRAPTRRPGIVPVPPTRRPTARPTRLIRPTATRPPVVTVIQTATPAVTAVTTTTSQPTVVDVTPTATATAGEVTPTATVGELTPTPGDVTPTASPTASELTPTPTATDVGVATPTPTVEPPPTDTPEPPPTDTAEPPPTDTAEPPPTDTPEPPPANTAEPLPTTEPVVGVVPYWPSARQPYQNLALSCVVPGRAFVMVCWYDHGPFCVQQEPT